MKNKLCTALIITFWILIIILLIVLWSINFIIDPATQICMEVQTSKKAFIIKDLSEEYVNSLGIIINTPIEYRFVKYKHEDYFIKNSTEKLVLLGSFHEWKSNYYIDISTNIRHMSVLTEVVRHETRHMIVKELKNRKIIDLIKYSEEIAQENNKIYNELFNNSVKLLKEVQNNG